MLLTLKLEPPSTLCRGGVGGGDTILPTRTGGKFKLQSNLNNERFAYSIFCKENIKRESYCFNFAAKEGPTYARIFTTSTGTTTSFQ